MDDKERVAAALENDNLIRVVNSGIRKSVGLAWNYSQLRTYYVIAYETFYCYVLFSEGFLILVLNKSAFQKNSYGFPGKHGMKKAFIQVYCENRFKIVSQLPLPKYKMWFGWNLESL